MSWGETRAPSSRVLSAELDHVASKILNESDHVAPSFLTCLIRETESHQKPLCLSWSEKCQLGWCVSIIYIKYLCCSWLVVFKAYSCETRAITSWVVLAKLDQVAPKIINESYRVAHCNLAWLILKTVTLKSLLFGQVWTVPTQMDTNWMMVSPTLIICGALGWQPCLVKAFSC